MKLTKCEQGHFYDGEKYPACPYCNTDLQADTAIVRTRTAAAPAETGTPEGPVTGWTARRAGATCAWGWGAPFWGWTAPRAP